MKYIILVILLGCANVEPNERVPYECTEIEFEYEHRDHIHAVLLKCIDKELETSGDVDKAFKKCKEV